MNALPPSVHHDFVTTKVVFDKNEIRLLFVAVGLLMLAKFIITRVLTGEVILPGVPEFKGVPILGTIPVYLYVISDQVELKSNNLHGLPIV